MSGHLQLHGVLPARTTARAGLPDHQLHDCGPLCAIVSDFPELASFEALPPEGVAKWALTHNAILTGYCADHAVLPMRVGSVFSGRAAIATELDAHRAQFCRALDMLKDLQEYSLQISIVDRPLSESPLAASGRDHLLQRRSLRESRKARHAAREAFVRDILRQIDGMAYQVEPVGAPKPDRLLHCVALIRRDEVQSFREVTKRASNTWRDLGVEVTTSGPWPAYSFDPASLLDPDQPDGR